MSRGPDFLEGPRRGTWLSARNRKNKPTLSKEINDFSC
jgi:hypothetical protein